MNGPAGSMALQQSLVGVDPTCPGSILADLTLVEVRFRDFDAKEQSGQLVVHRELAKDVEEVFALILQMRFPVRSAIPISDPRFGWNDHLSMAANNSSAFNYRVIAGTSRLSNHSLGRAVDINPVQNPWMKDGVVLPEGATYEVGAPGTFARNHPIVVAFQQMGWTWGGEWESLKDYHHFEKPGS